MYLEYFFDEAIRSQSSPTQDEPEMCPYMLTYLTGQRQES